MEIYRLRIERGSKTGAEADQVRKIDLIERDLRIAAIRAERDTFYELVRHRRLPEEAAQRLVRELDLMETRFAIG